ncbi:hypothetical protein [Oceanobacillus sp. CF4.6]|uniref:hypothetical protein n=1 Tax=Oceanobacillus sp. CF4.6 TaxID=3373080 RepID=UPI003EE6A3BA
MEQILLSKYARKIFFFISGVLFILILFIRLLLVPKVSIYLNQELIIIFNTILDAILSTGVSTVIIASLAFWLTPRVVKKSQMDIINPKEIKDYLEKARDTDEYWFAGGTGRFTRSKTIPKLATDARFSNFSKKIVLILINPDNDGVCSSYVKYRNRIRSGNKKTWDHKKIKKEILATIVSAYSWKKEQPLLEVTIGLIDHYSMFRIDLSTNLVVITKEDTSEPALMCEKETFFFKSYLEDLRLSLSQSNILTKDIEGILFNELNGAKIREFITSLGLNISLLDDDDFNDIAELVKKGENPYGY